MEPAAMCRAALFTDCHKVGRNSQKRRRMVREYTAHIFSFNHWQFFCHWTWSYWCVFPSSLLSSSHV